MLPPDQWVGYSGAMKTTLCIDTATAYCSVVLAHAGKVYSDSQRLERRHNEVLLEMLDVVLAEALIAPSNIALIGFNAGPGSFTGIRLAAAVVQSIALVSGAKVARLGHSHIAVSAAQAGDPVRQEKQQHVRREMHKETPKEAHKETLPEARRETPFPTDFICSIPSRAQLFYMSAYRCVAGEMVCEHSDELLDAMPAGWLSEWWQRDDVALVGPRPEWLPEKATPMARPMPADGESNVAVLLPLTMAYDAAGQTVTAAAALPIYVSGDSPWQTVAARRAAAQQAD